MQNGQIRIQKVKKSNKSKIIPPPTEVNEFIEYMCMFYLTNQIYGEFFNHNLTKGEITLAVHMYIAACKKLYKGNPYAGYCGDTFDREKVRDLLLHFRGETELEHQTSVNAILGA